MILIRCCLDICFGYFWHNICIYIYRVWNFVAEIMWTPNGLDPQLISPRWSKSSRVRERARELQKGWRSAERRGGCGACIWDSLWGENHEDISNIPYAIVIIYPIVCPIWRCYIIYFRISGIYHGKPMGHLSSVQNLCWLMIRVDSTIQYIGDYNHPI